MGTNVREASYAMADQRNCHCSDLAEIEHAVGAGTLKPELPDHGM